MLNNNATPPGGPAGSPPTGCPWSVNNCGPNDEPFSFHTGSVNVCFGDGSVRVLRDNLDPLVIKALATNNGGENVNTDF